MRRTTSQQRGDAKRVGAEDDRDARASGAQLLHHHRSMRGETASAPGRCRRQDPEHPVLGARADDVPVEVARILTAAAVDLERPRSNVSVGEPAGERPELFELAHPCRPAILHQSRELLLQ